MQVPFIDLKAPYNAQKNEIDAALQDILTNTAFIGGPRIEAFEKNFANHIGTSSCVAVSNGTEALFATLKVLGIGPGDEVIIPANTFIATAEAISHCGATPVFVDASEADYQIDVSQIENRITNKTRALLPVHLFGHPADMKSILEIARKKNLFVVEDAAQAHGALIGDRTVGTFGLAACYSFYPAKNLGAFGDAGAVVTNHRDLEEQLRVFINHGRHPKLGHAMIGTNARMVAMQAMVLDLMLKRLHEANEKRRANAAIYNELFAASTVADRIVTPPERDGVTPVYHLYVIQTEKRNELKSFLGENGIGAGIHYDQAVPYTRAYEHLGYTPEDCPVAHRLQDCILSLPMFPELKREQMEYVVSNIEKFFA